MTDKQKTIITLTFVSQSCTAALSSIGSVLADKPPLNLVLSDIDSLLALVYNLSTKLTLALKPPSPAYSASIPVLQELAQHASALAHCTCLLHDDIHGATLAKDIRNRIRDIIDALRALIQTFLNNAARSSHLAGSSEESLVRTGVLHDLTTNARGGPSAIPNDNQIAVYRAWKSDRDSLEDGVQEVARMIKEAEDQDDSVDDFDDGWDEIGLGGHTTNMTKDELARAKNVHQVLRLTTLLHKRVHLDILAHPSSMPPSAFDSLLTQSNSLLSVSDDLIAALYSPQDPVSVRKDIPKLVDIATSLQAQLAVFLPAADELATQMNALSVQDSSAAPISQPATKKKADKKWFDTCIHQIARSCANLSESSCQTENPNSGT